MVGKGGGKGGGKGEGKRDTWRRAGADNNFQSQRINIGRGDMEGDGVQMGDKCKGEGIGGCVISGGWADIATDPSGARVPDLPEVWRTREKQILAHEVWNTIRAHEPEPNPRTQPRNHETGTQAQGEVNVVAYQPQFWRTSSDRT